jgi:phage terminase large subunit-like protein
MEENVKLSRTLENYLENNRHEKQIKFDKNPSRSRWVFGGNRTGKTECGAAEVVLWALGLAQGRDNTRPKEGWVVSLSQKMSRDISQAKILKYLDEEQIHKTVMERGHKNERHYGTISFLVIKHKSGGLSKIHFKSCQQGREKFQGAGLDFVWFDEEPPEDIYQECLMRTMDQKGSVWVTMTPLKGKTWVYDKIVSKNDPDKFLLVMSWEDNPYLPQDEIKRMESEFDESTLESRKYGKFYERTGSVFNEFCDECICAPFEIPQSWFTCVSIDPGYINPTAVLWIAVDPDKNIYVFSEYYAKEQSIEQIANHISGSNYSYAIIDSAAAAKTLGNPLSVAEQFKRFRVSVDTKVEKGIIGGIMKMKSLFENKKLFIFKTCENLLKEINFYIWGKSELPVKKDDHCIDALRYFVSTVYENSDARAIMPPQRQKSVVGVAKQKFIKEAKSK